MNLSYTILSAILGGALTSGIIIACILLLLSKKIRKTKQSILAKELKHNKELEYLKLNIKQLNNHLQLETTTTAKLLDSFNVSDEQIENFVLKEKAKRQELTEKDKKKATKFKI